MANYQSAYSGAIHDQYATKAALLDLIYPIGSIIQSTTTATKADVIAVYGGSDWIQHSGYILRGGGTVTANQATKDGGNDNAIVVSHNHTATTENAGAHTHTAASAGAHTHTATTSSNGAHTHTAASNGAHTHTFNRHSGTDDSNFSGHVANAVASNDTTPAQGPVTTSSNGAHTHSTDSQGAHTHTLTTSSNGAHTHSTDSQGAHTHTLTTSTNGSDGINANIPNYKNVYIWERVA